MSSRRREYRLHFAVTGKPSGTVFERETIPTSLPHSVQESVVGFWRSSDGILNQAVSESFVSRHEQDTPLPKQCKTFFALRCCRELPLRDFRRMAFVSQTYSLTLRSKRRPRSMVSPQNHHRPHVAVARTLSEAKQNSANKQEPRKSDSSEAWKTGKVHAPRQIRGGERRFRGSVRSQGKRYGSRAPPNPPGMRVTAGVARGRRISSPNVYLRPMMGKVREALFTMLNSLGVLREDGVILDLFSGSGSVGVEALSRGMQRAVFVDSAQECVDSVIENLNHCTFEGRGQAVRARVEDFIPEGETYNAGRHYDLITITPPYEEVDYSELMTSVANSSCVGEGTFVVVEYPVELKSIPPAIGNRLVGVRNRRYGRTVLGVYACQPGVDIDLRSEEFIR